MKDVNKVILVGRLGNDPTERETKTGRKVVSFPIATSRRVKVAPKEDGGDLVGESGEGATETAPMQEETQWHRIVAWGRQGEVCRQYLRKGHTVFVEGALRSRRYEDQEGREKMSFEIVADSVSFLTSSRASLHATASREAVASA